MNHTVTRVHRQHANLPCTGTGAAIAHMSSTAKDHQAQEFLQIMQTSMIAPFDHEAWRYLFLQYLASYSVKISKC